MRLDGWVTRVDLGDMVGTRYSTVDSSYGCSVFI